MRRLGIALLFAFGVAAPVARAEEPGAPAAHEGAAHEAGAHEGAAHEGAAHHEGPLECTAASDDEQCAEYWEHHINWFSWDYTAGPKQSLEHRHMPPPFAFALLNFAVFAFILYKLAANPLKDFVRTRHVTIKKDLDEAAELHREAEARLRDYETRLAGLDAEIAALLAQVRAEAEAEKNRIVAGAKAQAERLAQEAESQIAAELERVRRELKHEVVKAAVAAAEEAIKAKSTAADQGRLAERFVAEIEGPRPTTAARS